MAVDPTEAHAFMERVRSKGPLTAGTLRDAARDATSPLHRLITWDMKKAADMQQKREAQSILTDLRTTRGQRVYAASGTLPGTRVHQYVPFSELMHQREYRRSQVDAFFRDIERLVAKYSFLNELTGQLRLLASLKPPKNRKAVA